MNSNISSSNTFVSSPANVGALQPGMLPTHNTQESRSIRIEQMLSDGRSETNNYLQNNQPLLQNIRQNQQFQQHMQQNQRPQPQNNSQQQNLRFPLNENLIKSQINPPHNNQSTDGLVQNNQRSPRTPYESQRIQIPPQVRIAGPQQSQRPLLNNMNGGISLNQSLQPRTDTSRLQEDQIRPNLQNVEQSENRHTTQFSTNPPVTLIRKSSDIDMKSPDKLSKNQISYEAAIKSKMRAQPPNVSNYSRTESKSNLLDNQIPSVSEIVSDSESKKSKDSSAENNANKKIHLEKKESLIKIDPKAKENIEKDNNNTKSNITRGMVQKNIKYFEENDTAKKPLVPPTTVKTKQKERSKSPPSDVIKSDANNNEYESGVDETPVIHPNLGSIFQIPRKVAKIPHLRSKKRLKKLKLDKMFTLKRPLEETLNKKPFHQKTFRYDVINPSRSCLHQKLRNLVNQKIKIYGSKEELLAFFENTNTWRKRNLYISQRDQNAAKDKVVRKPTTNGDIPTPKKTPSKLQTPSKKYPPLSPTKTPLKSPGTPGTPGTKSLPKTPESPTPSTPLIKKVPMNKIQVGAAPSPNLKVVKSKVGSLMNTTHKPGGGNVKIESHKIDLSNVQPRTEAKNDQYKPSGGDKKIQQVKLQWNAKSKVGSLENTTHKPGGGDKKIESIKLDFKEKAKPKVGSKDNVKHTPGGGNIKIENQKLEFKAQSKVGSLDNVKHKPGGGDIKIFDDKTYLRQVSGNSSEGRASGTQAFKEFSVIREVEGRSTPGTPGRNTSIKIRKMTTIDNSEESPKIKKITEVTVTSKTPKKETKANKSPTKVKVTYSKMSPLKNEEPENSVKLITVPARNDAPVLKPRLSKRDLSDSSDTGWRFNENEIKNELDDKSSYIRNTGNIKQGSESPNLSEGKSNFREDSEISKFLQDEIAAQEKIGEIWRERNAIESKSNLPINQQRGDQLKEHQNFSENYRIGEKNQQYKTQNINIKTGAQPNLHDFQRSNFYSNQTSQFEQLQNPPVQSHPQNQQRPFFPTSFPEEYKISHPQ